MASFKSTAVAAFDAADVEARLAEDEEEEEEEEDDGTIAIDLRAAAAAETADGFVLGGEVGEPASRFAVSLPAAAAAPPPFKPSSAPRPGPLPTPAFVGEVATEGVKGRAVAAVEAEGEDSERVLNSLVSAGGRDDDEDRPLVTEGGKSERTKASHCRGLLISTANSLKVPSAFLLGCRKRMLLLSLLLLLLPVESVLRSPMSAAVREATLCAAAAALSKEKDLAMPRSSRSVARAAGLRVAAPFVAVTPLSKERKEAAPAERPMALAAADSKVEGSTSSGLEPAPSGSSQSDAVGDASRVEVKVGAARTETMEGAACPPATDDRIAVPGAVGSRIANGARPSASRACALRSAAVIREGTNCAGPPSSSVLRRLNAGNPYIWSVCSSTVTVASMGSVMGISRRTRGPEEGEGGRGGFAGRPALILPRYGSIYK